MSIENKLDTNPEHIKCLLSYVAISFTISSQFTDTCMYSLSNGWSEHTTYGASLFLYLQTEGVKVLRWKAYVKCHPAPICSDLTTPENVNPNISLSNVVTVQAVFVHRVSALRSCKE